MLDSGHLAGYAVNDEFENKVVEALRGLAKPETFAAKYGIGKDQPVLLFAMGDGNHSLATAKADLGKDETAGRHGPSITLCAGRDRKRP